MGTGPRGSMETVDEILCVKRRVQRGVQADCPHCCPVVLAAGWLSCRAGPAPEGPGHLPGPSWSRGGDRCTRPLCRLSAPDLLQGSRGVFSLWSVLTPLIRPQLSFAFSPSFPDFPVLFSSFWPGRCCPKCSPVPSV